jgi:hypothetical protein
MANDFAVDQVWDAMQALLVAQLNGVDVAAAGEKDFDDSDALILNPPSVRGVFVREGAVCLENQHITYDLAQEYALLCADQDVSSDNQQQRRNSLILARQVRTILTGARIALGDGQVSEPILYVAMEPMGVEGLGIAYVLGFVVPGVAQFAAPNATPEGE